MKSFALTILLAAVATAQIPTVDWSQQKAEILRYHRSLVQIDTSNPPGNETKAAEYLKKSSTPKVSLLSCTRSTRRAPTSSHG